MRTGVEPGGLQVATHVGKRRPTVVADLYRPLLDHAVDVEHAEANRFHVKRADRDGERRALLEKARDGVGARPGLDAAHERLQPLVGRLPVIDGCRHDPSMVFGTLTTRQALSDRGLMPFVTTKDAETRPTGRAR